MNNIISYLLVIAVNLASQMLIAQTVYTSAEEITFRESFHKNVKINEDSTVIYTKYNGDYSLYEEYEGSLSKQIDGSYKMELALRKRFESVERHATFQFKFTVDSDSAYSADLQLNIWYYDEEEIPLQLNFPINSEATVDTIIIIKAANGLLIYSPFWNPTNRDEIVHKVAWNRAPKWTIYKSDKEKLTLYFKLDENEISFF
jgi:hypothetical protein